MTTPMMDALFAKMEPKTGTDGKLCKGCGSNATLIKKDSCKFCTTCGAIGACG